MDYILTVYHKNTYGEYALPQRQEGTWNVLLPGGLFELPGDLRLTFRYHGGQPSLLPSGAFMLRPAIGKRRFPLPVEAGGIYFLTPEAGGRLVLVMQAQSAPRFHAYRLDAGIPVTIGASPENLIVYGGGGAVSPVHAVIRARGSGHWLEDHSCNGVYINRRRLEGSSFLKFGDQIHIFGLSLVYLGDHIALDTSAEGLRLQDGLTPMPDSAVLKERLAMGLLVHDFRQSGVKGAALEAETVIENDSGRGGFNWFSN